MSSKFIISLDYELLWGMRDHASIASYGDAILGGRTAIPLMLERFRAHGIRATWATVGLLFARNQREMLDYAPQLRPAYRNKVLDPYPQVADLAGQDEASAPHFFGRSLIDRIAETEGQELGCHSYTHYFCMEEGQTPAQFKADIAACLAIAKDAGHAMKTLVFCRNQWRDTYVDAIADLGLIGFRGNPGGFLYRARPASGNTNLVRALRLADGALPLVGNTAFNRVERTRGVWNVPASRFLRPWSPGMAAYNALHVRRIKREMTQAARTGSHYHLWWHPHNMGRHSQGNLAQLDALLAHFRILQERHGMQSATMADMAEEAQREAGG